jgi:hypothetical protein
MAEICKGKILRISADLLILEGLLLLTSIYVRVLRGVTVQDVSWRTFLIHAAPILDVVEKEPRQRLRYSYHIALFVSPLINVSSLGRDKISKVNHAYQQSKYARTRLIVTFFFF